MTAAALAPTVICAWCKVVQSEGTLPPSHTICDDCAREHGYAVEDPAGCAIAEPVDAQPELAVDFTAAARVLRGVAFWGLVAFNVACVWIALQGGWK